MQPRYTHARRRPWGGAALGVATTTAAGEPPPAATAAPADIVRGPSLLRTSVASRPRPSLLHLPGLRALPIWTLPPIVRGDATRVAYGEVAVTAAVRLLEAHWEQIWREYQTAAPNVPSDYQTDTEHHALHRGGWDWHSYMTKGVVDGGAGTAPGTAGASTTAPGGFAQRFPYTAGVLAQLRATHQLFEGTPFGYAFFSTLHPNSSIQPHAAPMNLRLRVHLALSVPAAAAKIGSSSGAATGDGGGIATGASASPGASRPPCGIRVGAVTQTWQTGQCVVLDDAYEHEVWNETDEARVVLLVDLWHPDVLPHERREIVHMFDGAKEKGWLS